MGTGEVVMHALLSILTEALTALPGRRWHGFVAAAVGLLVIWFILLAIR